MKTLLATLAAGALLASASLAPAPAMAANLKIKSGVSAKDAGRCAAATVLFAKLSEQVSEKKSPEFDELAGLWIAYITGGDSAFGEEAANEMGATATRYQAAGEGEKGAEGILAAVVGDMADCMDKLTTT